MKFVLVHLSSKQPAWLTEALNEFETKISPIVKFEIVHLSTPAVARDNSAEKIQQESDKLLKLIKPDDFIVVFDERGLALDSQSFAKKTNQILNSGKKRALFIVGGAFGVSDAIRKKANLTLSLAPFVMNHQVAQIVAAEQIFRSLTILKGLPYHNQ